jgi:hypothetical protein
MTFRTLGPVSPLQRRETQGLTASRGAAPGHESTPGVSHGTTQHEASAAHRCDLADLGAVRVDDGRTDTERLACRRVPGGCRGL